MKTIRAPLTWVTSQLAVGSAPMSDARLDDLHRQGIVAILNLCGEYCDLHTIEQAHGFEVYYLPIADEEAPDLEAMEHGLAWLDEALYLGKKVFIHCRHGIGRTGTVLNLYLLRKGLGHAMAGKILKNLRSKPANFEQWWTVRKYGRQTGRLTVRPPSLEVSRKVDLQPFLKEYQAVQQRIDGELEAQGVTTLCGKNNAACCRTPVRMTLIEAEHLRSILDVTMRSRVRAEIIARAALVARKEREMEGRVLASGKHCLYASHSLCPFSQNDECLIFGQRPLQCRTFGLSDTSKNRLWGEIIAPVLDQTSGDVFFALTGSFPPAELPLFSLPDVASGRYASMFFHMIKEKQSNTKIPVPTG
ncbi:MAG: dual specificity protein phosphatase family protein [Desulfoplanes sp.]